LAGTLTSPSDAATSALEVARGSMAFDSTRAPASSWTAERTLALSSGTSDRCVPTPGTTTFVSVEPGQRCHVSLVVRTSEAQLLSGAVAPPIALDAPVFPPPLAAPTAPSTAVWPP
jgi:hypothetical protein